MLTFTDAALFMTGQCAPTHQFPVHPSKDYSRLDVVTFYEAVFSHNKYSDYLEDIANASVLKFQVSSKNHVIFNS